MFNLVTIWHFQVLDYIVTNDTISNEQWNVKGSDHDPILR